MSGHSANMVYPKDKFHIILQSSLQTDEFYGLDDLERRKLKIFQAKYGCRHCYHTLPDHVTLNLNKFYWNESKGCYEIDLKNKTSIRLNTLEEAIINFVKDDYMQYLFW